MLRAQAELRQMVPGFTFNAGFVGGYYNSGALMEEVSSVGGGDLPLEGCLVQECLTPSWETLGSLHTKIMRGLSYYSP